MKNKGLLSPRQIILRHEATDLLSRERGPTFRKQKTYLQKAKRLCVTNQQTCF